MSRATHILIRIGAILSALAGAMTVALAPAGASWAAAAAAGSAAAHAAAGPALYTVTPGASRTAFYAHATGHDFSGTTTDVRGHVRFDAVGSASTPAPASGEVRVGIATLETGIANRNQDMRELLESEKHPDFVFELEGIKPEGVKAEGSGTGGGAGPAAPGGLPAKLALQGTMQVRGARRPLSVTVELESGEDWIVVRGEFPLDIRDFGIEPPRAMLFIKMDPVVKVDFEARFQRLE